MSDKDEKISVRDLLIEHIKDSREWRKESDKKIQAAQKAVDKANELTTISHNLITSELDKLIESVKKLTDKTNENSTDIAFVNDIKVKANWGWNTAKYISFFFAGLFAFFAGVYHLYEFLKNYFKGA